MNNKIKSIVFGIALIMHPTLLHGMEQPFKAVSKKVFWPFAVVGSMFRGGQKLITEEELEDVQNLLDEVREFSDLPEGERGKLPFLLITPLCHNVQEIHNKIKDYGSLERAFPYLNNNKDMIRYFISELRKMQRNKEESYKEWEDTSISVGSGEMTYLIGDAESISQDKMKIVKNFTYNGLHYFAVFDGHEGTGVAEYAQNNLDQILKKFWLEDSKNVEVAFEKAFSELDDNLFKQIKEDCLKEVSRHLEVSPRELKDEPCTDNKLNPFKVGSTALVALIDSNKNMLYVAWAGDSRALVIRNGRKVFNTVDHTLNREEERIRTAGGAVNNGRVVGTAGKDGRITHLAVARSFGDYYYGYPDIDKESNKYSEKVISSKPDVKSFKLEKGDIILLFSDGISDAMGRGEDEQNEELVKIVTRLGDKTMQEIVDFFIRGYRFYDDASLIGIQVK